jgi:Cu-Zn family superoxide dismutase
MYVTYTPGVGTTTDVETHGMTPGPHGLHIHEFGDLSNDVTGASTGGHYNPLDEIHGCYPTPVGELPAEARAVGDRGNVLVGDNGTGFYSERTNELVFLDGALSIIGRAAIVHALEDNCD